MKEYIFTPPKVKNTRFTPAHLIYRIANGRLLREQIPLSLRGGMMVIGRIDKTPDISLCSSIVRECMRFDFEAVLAALSPIPRDDDIAFAHSLHESLSKKDIPLYLPLPYINECDVAIVPGFVTEGKFSEQLKEMCRNHAPSSLALELSDTPLDFIMPMKSLFPITYDKLHTLLEQTGAMTFYSADLCSNYFTYSDSSTHLITFDTAQSLINKKNIAMSLGFNSCIYALSPQNLSIRQKLEVEK